MFRVRWDQTLVIIGVGKKGGKGFRHRGQGPMAWSYEECKGGGDRSSGGTRIDCIIHNVDAQGGGEHQHSAIGQAPSSNMK